MPPTLLAAKVTPALPFRKTSAWGSPSNAIALPERLPSYMPLPYEAAATPAFCSE